MREKTKSTMVEFVDELRKLPPCPGVEAMIGEAIAGEYHDYKNNKYACGKVAAYTKLMEMGFSSLANRIKEGEFDEQADEHDKEEMRKYAPKEMWGILGL